MGYIGNEPTTGHFPVQTNLVGPGPTYTLDRAPANAGAIEVSVQGVLQPTTAYSVSGTTLTMAGVASSIPIFIRYLGETLTIQRDIIANDAVTTPKIIDLGVTTAKIGANAVDGTKIAMGSDAAGDVLTYNGTDYIRLAKGTASQVLKMNAGASAIEWATDAGGIAIPASSATGDILYYNGSVYTRLAVGTNGHLLTLASGVPSWAAAAASGMQVQEDYFSMNMSRATGTTVVTLDTDFTATPQVMWMTYNNNYGAGGFITAWMNVEGETAGTQNPGNSTYGQGNSYLQANTGAGRQDIDFRSSTSGASSAATYTIHNNKVANPTGTGYFSVLVFG